VLNLALRAPQTKGIAPTIFYMDSTGGHWVADHAWGGIGNGEYLPMFHNAWTCYWLLQWIDFLPQRKAEIIVYTKAFADFLLAHQSQSGVIPSWYHPETLEPANQLKDENAETAGAALFLATFYEKTGEKHYLDAAERCMQYVFTNIFPERKWFDFETFFSCSRKPIGFYDSFTQQHPQNTLSMHQAAEACYELYKLTNKKVYREKGIQITDYLCLFQQVWSPKWLSRELFGGFGVQNTDAEWSDSRQGYFAVTLMKYYELTGRREYFERGVAALRAMFSLFESPTSPRTAENYAHSGFDQPAGVTGIHWGTGSSVVSIHLITQRYGDAYINVKDRWGVGIDGCRIPGVTVNRSTIKINILDNVSTPRKITMKFGHLDKPEYQIEINGKKVGKFSAGELRKGIRVAI
jgi:rhamnogalacturonyl hydrolase YesR